MSKPNWLECPVCVRPLVELSCKQGVIRPCETCGGVWLSAAQSRRVTAGTLSAEERKLAREATRRFRSRQRGGTYRSVLPAADGERACPVCEAPLALSTVAPVGVVVDRCDLHGTWFDAGELRIVARWFELRARGLDEELASLAMLLQRGARRSRRRGKAR